MEAVAMTTGAQREGDGQQRLQGEGGEGGKQT